MLRNTKILLVVFIWLIHTGCDQTKGDSNTKQAPSIAIDVTQKPHSIKIQAEKDSVRLSIIATDTFPFTNEVLFNEEMLAGLCTFEYGCLEEEIFPIGWSKDSKFAYFITEPSEAVEIFSIHFIIQQLETDKELVRDSWNSGEMAGWSKDDKHFFNEVWSLKKDLYRKQLQFHGIQVGRGIECLSKTQAESATGFQFEMLHETRQNALFEISEWDKCTVNAQKSGARKTISNRQFKEYDLILDGRILGAFRSPFEDRIAVLTGLEKRGWEGPPNILQLGVIGCWIGE